jgi:hypothetical protein
MPANLQGTYWHCQQEGVAEPRQYLGGVFIRGDEIDACRYFCEAPPKYRPDARSVPAIIRAIMSRLVVNNCLTVFSADKIAGIAPRPVDQCTQCMEMPVHHLAPRMRLSRHR